MAQEPLYGQMSAADAYELGRQDERQIAIKQIVEELKTRWPHGHKEFIPRLLAIMQLHSDKGYDYALGGHPLGNFTRMAHIMRLYPKFQWATDYGCATMQMLKQLDAFLWQVQDLGFQPKVEGPDSRLRDIAVFSQLIAIMLAEEKHQYDTV